MSLTNAQILSAYANLTRDLLAMLGTMPYLKPEMKQAIVDAEAWAETPAVKADFNLNLTAGDFKTNASADEKRLVLIFALLSIVEA